MSTSSSSSNKRSATSSSSSFVLVAFAFLAFFVLFIVYSNRIVSLKENNNAPVISTTKTNANLRVVESSAAIVKPATVDIPVAKEFSNLVNMTIMTTIGPKSMMVRVHPEWAPLGSKRFMELIDARYYDDCRFFRVIKVSTWFASINLLLLILSLFCRISWHKLV